MSKKDFEEFFRGVKPLKNRSRVVVDTPNPPAAISNKAEPSMDSTPHVFMDDKDASSYSPQVEILDHPDRKIMRKIQTGKTRIEATLDLHGCSYQKAQEAVLTTIEKSVRAGRKWILIITGKGVNYSGVLRNNLPLWLSQPRVARHIISVMPAHQKDGGMGAFYVHLRTKSPAQ